MAKRDGFEDDELGDKSDYGATYGSYQKWATPNTSTVPDDPSQQITRAKDKSKGIAPSVSTPAPAPPSAQVQGGQQQQTISDGSTDVVVSHLRGINPQLGELPEDEKEHHAPCINPSCKSFGHWHPNCLCYAGPGGTSLESGMFAKGGVIGHKFCSKNQKHNPKCEYYSEGGHVAEAAPMPMEYQDNPEDTIGHAAIEHGLLGLLTEVGHKKLAAPEKHVKRLHQSMSDEDREGASQSLNGHPLAGMVSARKLGPIMDRLAEPVMSKEPHPEAFRNSVDYLSSSMRGHNSLETHAKELFESKDFSEKLEPDSEAREKLKKHLDSIQESPQKMLEVGGSLGHYLPEHASSLGAQAAISANYLSSMKPTQTQNGPLDTMSPVDKMAEAKYNRALDIAHQPLMAMYYAKEGSLQPQDVKTLQVLYPGLYKSMIKKIGRHLIEAKADNVEIPYKKRMGLSLLLGQALDSTMRPMAMQAIIHANAGAQTQQSSPQKPKKASGTELKQINKVNDMDATRLQDRQIDKNKK